MSNTKAKSLKLVSEFVIFEGIKYTKTQLLPRGSVADVARRAYGALGPLGGGEGPRCLLPQESRPPVGPRASCSGPSGLA